jgi:hypothetical protein
MVAEGGISWRGAAGVGTMAGDGSRIGWVGGCGARNGERPWGRCVKVLWVVGDAQLKVGGHDDGGMPWGMLVKVGEKIG